VTSRSTSITPSLDKTSHSEHETLDPFPGHRPVAERAEQPLVNAPRESSVDPRPAHSRGRIPPSDKFVGRAEQPLVDAPRESSIGPARSRSKTPPSDKSVGRAEQSPVDAPRESSVGPARPRSRTRSLAYSGQKRLIIFTATDNARKRLKAPVQV